MKSLFSDIFSDCAILDIQRLIDKLVIFAVFLRGINP